MNLKFKSNPNIFISFWITLDTGPSPSNHSFVECWCNISKSKYKSHLTKHKSPSCDKQSLQPCSVLTLRIILLHAPAQFCIVFCMQQQPVVTPGLGRDLHQWHCSSSGNIGGRSRITHCTNYIIHICKMIKEIICKKKQKNCLMCCVQRAVSHIHQCQKSPLQHKARDISISKWQLCHWLLTLSSQLSLLHFIH